MSVEKYLAKLNAENKENKRIESTPICDLIKPITKIAEEMKYHIENGDYAMVIGDDASGRIPTLIMSEIINKTYEQNERPKVDTRFLALYPTWNYPGTWAELVSTSETMPVPISRRQEYAAEKIKKEFTGKIDKDAMNGKKILVVTELISGGNAMRPLLKTLSEAGFAFDVACVGALKTHKELKELDLGADKFFIGDDKTPAIYAKKDISGVVKNEKAFDLRSLPTKKPFNPEEQRFVQDRINKAREDVHKVASLVLESVWGKK